MANTSSLFGMRPIKYKNGTPWNGAVSVYYVSASDSAVIYKGTPVAVTTTAANCDSTGKYITVRRAAANETLVGVAIGFGTTPYIAADPTNLMLNKRTASTAMYAFVVDDPNVVFEIQESEVTADIATPVCAADVGCNADIVAGSGSAGSTAYGNDTTGISYACLDSTSAATKHGTPAAGQLKIIGLADLPNNDIGAYAKWNVMISSHLFLTQSIGGADKT
jgi:hypothetical protein